MRRAEFLRLTGQTIDDLKNFERRVGRPFAAEAENEATSYDHRQAFATRLTIRLGDYLDLKQAKIVVENYLDTFVAKFGSDLVEGKPIFFGYGRHNGPATDKNGREIYLNDVGLVAGPIGGLVESIIVDDSQGRFADFELVPLGSRKPRLSQVALIDAAAELTELRRNGGDHPLTIEWMNSGEARG